MWGRLFRGVDGTAVTELRVTNLVKYLESMQQKPAER
jgi:hypothetical protein